MSTAAGPVQVFLKPRYRVTDVGSRRSQGDTCDCDRVKRKAVRATLLQYCLYENLRKNTEMYLFSRLVQVHTPQYEYKASTTDYEWEYEYQISKLSKC